MDEQTASSSRRAGTRGSGPGAESAVHGDACAGPLMRFGSDRGIRIHLIASHSGILILIALLFVLPLLGSQTGYNLNVASQAISGGTEALIRITLHLTGNV